MDDLHISSRLVFDVYVGHKGILTWRARLHRGLRRDLRRILLSINLLKPVDRGNCEPYGQRQQKGEPAGDSHSPRSSDEFGQAPD